MDKEKERKEEEVPFLQKSQETSNAAIVAEKVPRKSSLVSAGSQRSRFQVAKVDFASIPESGRGNGESEEEEDRDDNEDRRNGVGAQSPTHQSNDHTAYDTHYLRSLRHYTREPLPRAAHYRDIRSIHTHMDRPTLDDLHNPPANMLDSDGYKSPEARKKSEAIIALTSGSLKLGWIQGVFVRCILNIWGVMLFLRLSWVVGQAGILEACCIIILSTVVTFLTTLSMSAICTNGEVKGGGTYYMISRSLGPEFGGAIGAIFCLANAVAVAMYVVGFAENVVDVLKDSGAGVFVSDATTIRIIGVVTTTVLLCISLIGMGWESKAQQFLLVILLAAIFNFLIGSVIPPSEIQMSKGFLGFSSTLVVENWGRSSAMVLEGHSFMSLFAIFFPAATGILAGANISGDLADPSKSIPKGTVLAILVTSLTYLVIAIISGATVLREANGIVDYVGDLSLLTNCTITPKGVCEYGLLRSKQVMEIVSVFGPLINAGVFAATLSSALASLVSAPKVFQALCKDNLFPYIHVFARGYGPAAEPRRAYLLTYIIAIGFVLIGELDTIAPIISNFFLAAYCLVNFSCFHSSCTNSPGFRPSFKFYNKWVSLFGALLCLIVMFIMGWDVALATFALVLFLYIYIYYRKPDVNWGSSTQAETYSRALRAVVKLNYVPDHVKTYRPQLLVLTGRPSSRVALLDFANLITKKLSLLVCGDIEAERISSRTRHNMIMKANNFFRKRKIDAFYDIREEKSFPFGAKALMELSGIGKLRPNVLLMGYKSTWQDVPVQEVVDYFMTIHHAFDLHLSVCILRVPERFDVSEHADSIEEMLVDRSFKLPEEAYKESPEKDLELGFPRNTSSAQLSAGGSSREASPPATPTPEQDKGENGKNETSFMLGGDDKDEKTKPPVTTNNFLSKRNSLKLIPKEVLMHVNRFQRKQKKGTIDVWWLYDDGGLTMLIPYILTTRSQFSNCSLRVFTLANRKDELDREKRNMAALLSKFRIDFSDVTVIPDIVKPPTDASVKEFDALIAKYRESEEEENEESNENDDSVIKESELVALKDKNRRHMRLRELLLHHSSEASLIVMTLTVPRKGTCSAPLFMAWLETLTKGMPPFLLIRGNQTSVLTFYS